MSLAVCIDATLPGLAVSLVDRETTLWQSVHSEQNKISHLMAQNIALGLKNVGKRVDDIEAVVVAVGPGSFTGIKVSLAFAYGLVETGITRRMSFGVSSLSLLCEEYAKRSQAPVALILRSTQSAGYICFAGPTQTATNYVIQVDHKRGLIYRDQDCRARTKEEALRILNDFKVISLGAWPEALQVIEVGIEEVKVETALRDSLNLMQNVFRNEWPQGFSAEISAPIYLRPSSPEEKILLSKISE